MSVLPPENHTLIIQTFAEKEPERREIKKDVTTRGEEINIQRILSERMKPLQSHEL